MKYKGFIIEKRYGVCADWKLNQHGTVVPKRPTKDDIDSTGLQMSVQRRQVTGGDVYLLFNESYTRRSDPLRIEGAFREARLLDPETGETLATNLEGDVLTVTLEGARAAVLWVTRPDL